jgi:hypothetical protein
MRSDESPHSNRGATKTPRSSNVFVSSGARPDEQVIAMTKVSAAIG